MISALASRFVDHWLCRAVLTSADLHIANLPAFGLGVAPVDYWTVVVGELERGAGGHHGVFQLLVAAIARFPGDSTLRGALAEILAADESLPSARIAWACRMLRIPEDTAALVPDPDAVLEAGGPALEARLAAWSAPFSVLDGAPGRGRLLGLLWLDPSRLPSIVHGETDAAGIHYDIIISHTDEDDAWVSRFEEVAIRRTAFVLGHEPRTLRIRRVHPVDREATWHRALATARVFVAVVSPAYVSDEQCNVELRRFVALSDGTVFKVVRTPAQSEPAELAQRPSHTFPPPADPERPDDASSTAFIQAAMNVGEELATRLGSGRAEEPDDDTPRVFLATASGDIATLNSVVRNELLGRGLRVMASNWSGESAPAFESETERRLSSCDLSIHAVGSLPTPRPEGATASLAEIELRHAETQWPQRGMRRILWIPPGLEPPTDRHQQRFVGALREDPAHHDGADIVFGPISELHSIVRHRIDEIMRGRATAGDVPNAPDDPTVPHVYLVSHPSDAAAAQEVEDYLRSLEIDVLVFDATDETLSPEDLRRNHEAWLKLCHAYLIHYGKARDFWVREQLREALRANALERDHRLEQRDVYVAPPVRPEKKRFQTAERDVKVHRVPDGPPSAAAPAGASILQRWQLEPLHDFAEQLKADHRRRGKT